VCFFFFCSQELAAMTGELFLRLSLFDPYLDPDILLLLNSMGVVLTF